ncbi:hypothetical protein CGRA01v4_01950 [Colletotrichum graminicola]|nr:hypothetical protein CGRA01v4_01950 [Colletotrichum graminicola]
MPTGNRQHRLKIDIRSHGKPTHHHRRSTGSTHCRTCTHPSGGASTQHRWLFTTAGPQLATRERMLSDRDR